MDNTPNLALPLLAEKQALQTTFHDEALTVLDAVVMLSVIDRDLSSPPASPSDGDRYLVKAPGAGDPAWLDNQIVVYAVDRWIARAPRPGWTCYVEDEGALIAWDGTAWQPALDVLGGGAANNLALLGVGTTADAANPFSAKLNNALWTAKTVAEGGDGHLRTKMSKESAAKTLSLLMQTNFSGRAEIGLTGDDDLHVKTSADGSTWIDALVIDRATGGVRFVANEVSLASAATCDIGAAAGLKVNVTGTTAIISFGTQPNCIKLVRFSGALTLTHNGASLILPGGGNIKTAAGDTAFFASDASGNWRCWQYTPAAHGWPAPQCGRLTYVSTTAIKFAPKNGDHIKINGALYQIPAAGIAGAANTSVFVNGVGGQNLAASTLYYVYAFLNSGVVTADFQTAGRSVSATAGNEGVEILTGSDSRTLIGMVYTNASSQFTYLGTASWFNRRAKSAIGSISTTRTYTSATPGELHSEIRVPFVTWGDETVQIAVGGKGYPSATANHAFDTSVSFDGAGVEAVVAPVQAETTSSSYKNISVSILKDGLSEGGHYATIFSAVGGAGQTATYDILKLQVGIRG